MKTVTLPTWISFTRAVMSPLLVWLGGSNRPVLFLQVFAILLVSDFLDGFLARRLRQITELGSQADTAGDVAMCICAIAGGWLLWPERVEAEAVFFLSVLGLLAVSGTVSLIKYRRLPSYHTWSAKISTAAAGAGVWILFAGITPWLFRFSIGLLAYSALDETLITLTLPEWKPNIPTFFHAVRLRRKNARQTDL